MMFSFKVFTRVLKSESVFCKAGVFKKALLALNTEIRAKHIRKSIVVFVGAQVLVRATSAKTSVDTNSYRWVHFLETLKPTVFCPSTWQY